MDEFKTFLAKVLEPIEVSADPHTTLTSPGAAGEAADSTPVVYRGPADRYVAVMNALLADAQARKAVDVFTDVVTWKLAVVAFNWGPRVAGDIVRSLGNHLAHLAEMAEAQHEAEAEKEAGRQPN